MPLACSSPVAARGVGLAHEERGSLPWLEARNQHTGGLSRRRLGGPLSGSSARPWLLVADILVGAPRVGTAVNDVLRLPDAGAEARAG